MDKATNRIIKKYIHSVLMEQPNLTSAYLFGSYAKNKQRSESDIDIALIIEDLSDADRFNTQVRLMMLASSIDSRIEPHPISKSDLFSDNPFSVEVRRTGIELALK